MTVSVIDYSLFIINYSLDVMDFTDVMDVMDVMDVTDGKDRGYGGA